MIGFQGKLGLSQSTPEFQCQDAELKSAIQQFLARYEQVEHKADPSEDDLELSKFGILFFGILNNLFSKLKATPLANIGDLFKLGEASAHKEDAQTYLYPFLNSQILGEGLSATLLSTEKLLATSQTDCARKQLQEQRRVLIQAESMLREGGSSRLLLKKLQQLRETGLTL